MLIALLAAALAAPSASAAPTPPVRVITDETSRKACEYLGLISVRKAMGPNKAGGALKKALEKVSQMGGNGLFLLNQSQTWTDGASVSGEALRCPTSALP
jgi:hypothetical protein